MEIPLAKALYREGFRVVISNPRQTNQFAMSQSRTKTDAKDAKMLASYTQMLVLCGELEKQLYTPPTPEQEQLEPSFCDELSWWKCVWQRKTA